MHQEVERRNNNLLIHGLGEPAWETKQQVEKAARDYISGSLGVDHSTILFKDIHRVGKREKRQNKRPILVSFQS